MSLEEGLDFQEENKESKQDICKEYKITEKLNRIFANKEYKYGDDRFLDKENFGEIFRSKDLAFHALKNPDINKIISILNLGILTKKSLIKNLGQDLGGTIYNHNGLDHVSISNAPLFNYYTKGSASSLSTYTLSNGGVSFILDSKLNKRFMIDGGKSGFYDESYVYGDIPVSKIKGIIIDEKILTQKMLNIEGNTELGIFIFQKIKEDFKLKIYNQRGFEISL